MKLEPVAYRFTENRGNGKTEFSYYSPEQLATAYRDNCLAITPLYAIPEGYVVVPVEPTEAQWSGLARDIMFVLRQERPTPKKLFYHLTQLGHTLPNWVADETELRDPASDHVISKGTCCALIYKAMLTAAAKGE